MISHFDTVLVENHPRLVNKKVLEFRDSLKTDLQVAMGLETVHPEVLPRLNKQMTLDDFSNASMFLRGHDIKTRAFILLRPPFLSEAEGVEWAKRSIDFSFDAGVECCAVIPTRAGNGAMEVLQRDGFFYPPNISSLEEVLDYGIGLKKGRVFADLWDLERFADCDQCFEERKVRMHHMNLQQVILSGIECSCQESGSAASF
jgi:radical SAM enzyme (TIGR01210 family)